MKFGYRFIAPRLISCYSRYSCLFLLLTTFHNYTLPITLFGKKVLVGYALQNWSNPERNGEVIIAPWW